MTRKIRRRRPPVEERALKFLVEDFIDIGPQDVATEGLAALRDEAAQTLLPDLASLRGLLLRMPLSDFQKLRRKTRTRLGMLAQHSTLAPKGVGLHQVISLKLVLMAGAKPGGAPIVDGAPEDVLWFYVTHLVTLVGSSRLALCTAPRSKREDLKGGQCLRVYVTRGTSKQFCSARCRARVATQRARMPRTKRRTR
jgi:hypothetical protein